MGNKKLGEDVFENRCCEWRSKQPTMSLFPVAQLQELQKVVAVPTLPVFWRSVPCGRLRALYLHPFLKLPSA